MKKIDVLIIGGGPMGVAMGIEAQKNKLSHLIIEKGTLINSIYHFPKKMTFFSTSQKLEIGEVPFMSINPKPTRDEALEYYRRVVEKWNLNIKYYEKVCNVEKDKTFKIITEKNTYYADNVVIATGFYDKPNLLNVPGENLEKVSHYFSDAHQYIGQKVMVVGAGNSATQTALELYDKGIDVSMVIRGSEIKPSVKYWIKPNIENRIAEGSIQAYFNSTIQEIKTNSVTFIQNDIKKTVENNFVFAMTGYHPNYKFLEKIGITCEKNDNKTPLFNLNTHQTNIKGLYIAGVICGGFKTNTYFIENSIEHAHKIIHSIIENRI